MEGKSQEAAAAASGMSERSVRTWRKGPLPSEKKDKRRKRTKPDPFAGVWDEEIVSVSDVKPDRPDKMDSRSRAVSPREYHGAPLH